MSLNERKYDRAHWFIYVAIMCGILYFSIKERNWIMGLLAVSFTTVYYFLRRKNQRKIDKYTSDS